MTRESSGPLCGVRVLDFTWMLAGPYCTMLLADLGADVIKIEPPLGDPMRQVGPFLEDDQLRAYGGYFQSVNRNKRSVVIDLKSEHGCDLVRRLAGGADLVVENFRAGVMERLGIGYETLRAMKPSIVYGSIRGFGDERGGKSPHLNRPAVDVTIQAEAGLMGITGPPGGVPTKTGPGVGDIFPGTLCALGLVSAMYNARNTGQGQYVDVAMYDGLLSLCERIVYRYSYEGEVSGPAGNAHPLFVPFDVFPTADGFVTIGASEDPQWGRLCEAMGRDEMARDARFATADARLRHAVAVRDLVGAWTLSHTAAEVVEAVGLEIPVGAVNTIEDIWHDDHPWARQMLVEVEQPGSSRRVVIAGCPIKLSETAARVRTRAPLLGEHTDSVLAELAAGGKR